MQEKLAQTKSSLRRVGSRTKEKMDRYTLSLMEHGVRSAEADLAWPDARVVVLTDPQLEFESVFQTAGWRVFVHPAGAPDVVAALEAATS